MKVRYAALLLTCFATALVAAGCGSDSDSTSEAKLSKAEKAVAQDRENKEKMLSDAKKAFKKNASDVGACRQVAMSYVALASPASPTDPKKVPAVPKDRDKNLKKSIDTLKDCQKIDPNNRDVQQMLASSYMGTGQYEEAAGLYRQLTKTASAAEKPNAFYSLGLAASNAQDYKGAIEAYEQFIETAEPKDPRITSIKQSIKSLETALKNPPPAPAEEKKSDKKDD